MSINRINFKSMLELQNTLNSVINANWIIQNYPFLRAAFVEAAEALEHHGWKWWKSQTPDYYQLQIELIDILHFYLSDILIQSNGDIDQAIAIIENEIKETKVSFDGKDYTLADIEILDLLELIGSLSAVRRRSFAVLDELMKKCALTWEEAYSQYASKNILNLFRQDNGYRSGEYIKIWDGEEDNVWLEKISKTMDINSQDYPKQLKSALEDKYTSIKSKSTNSI
ncbi:dUTP diphosphatase [Pseudomonas asplenii]|uniref:dUTP diphosphatase n=1 Tax=Pseudomonas asplenii TaxID=53407 RepID=UPI00235E3BBA|nr:dUTP diphosphatase [Pseudomonas asplenii]